MTTATIGREIIHSLNGAMPWWRRQDTYVLAVVAAIHAAVVGPAMLELNEGRWSIAGAGCWEEVLYGIVCAQCFLLSIWAALGRFGTLVRWSIVGSVFLLGVASFGYWARSGFDVGSQCLGAGLLGALVVTSFAAALLPLRGMAGWRVDFDCAHYAHVQNRRGQVSLVDFAAMSCAIAVPLAIMRLSAEAAEETAGSQWPAMLSGMAAIGAIAAPTCYCMLAWRSLPLALMAGGGWAFALGLTHGLLSRWITGLDILGSDGTWTDAWLGATAFHGTIAVVCGGTLAALRLSGLQLLIVPLSQSTVHASRQQIESPITLRKAA